MTEAWAPLCLTPACDLGEADWPLPVVVVDADLRLVLGGTVQVLEEVYPHLALAISRSAKGAAVLDRLEALLAEGGRSLDGLREDLSPNQDVQAGIAAGLARALARSQRRVAGQARELSQMRGMAERSLQNFARLEAFVWQTVKPERQLTTSLPVRVEEPGLPLTEPVEQRLPGGSTGLSDVAVCVAEAGAGRLTATLTLLESAEVVGAWEVQDPPIGWLRLALPRALGSDGQTPILRLEWQGAPAELCRSHPHPDPRYRCQGGNMLALRVWRHIAGTVAPLAPGSVPAEGGPAVGRWLMGAQALAGYPPEGAEIRLALCAPPGLVHVQAWVRAEAQTEVTLSVGAASLTQWILGREQVHLWLPAPLDKAADLVLTAGGAVQLEAVEFLADGQG